MDKYRVDDVFGVSRDEPLNYVDRDYVDQEFLNNLVRDKHIVVYGGSKQGKTSLRKHCLDDRDYILIQCSNRMKLDKLFESILKQAGFKISVSSSRTSSGKQKINASFSVSIPGILGINVGPEKETEKKDEDVTRPFEIDTEDVNDVIDALNSVGFNKYIVVEDFHYLEVETQADFSVALKAFHERSKMTFIVIGVWLEGDRLTTYNGDLLGRIVSVDADKWDKADLYKVIEKGAQLLNITFDDDFCRVLIENCFNSVYLVQEVCQKICRDSNILETQHQSVKLGENVDVKDMIGNIVSKNNGRYEVFIRNFANGFQSTQLDMYRWILYSIVISPIDEIEHGIRLTDVNRKIKNKHPQGTSLNAGSLTQALQSVSSLQVTKGIKPIIVDYDASNRILNTVDRQFLVWFSSQRVEDMLITAGFDDPASVLP